MSRLCALTDYDSARILQLTRTRMVLRPAGQSPHIRLPVCRCRQALHLLELMFGLPTRFSRLHRTPIRRLHLPRHGEQTLLQRALPLTFSSPHIHLRPCHCRQVRRHPGVVSGPPTQVPRLRHTPTRRARLPGHRAQARTLYQSNPL